MILPFRVVFLYLSAFLSVSHGFFTPSDDINKTIPLLTPTTLYSEICFKDGTTKSDLYVGFSSPSIGEENCRPGDRGFILEREVRKAKSWEEAFLTCLKLGMRLPTVFEWQVSCYENQNRSLNVENFEFKKPLFLGMQDIHWEWVSNFMTPIIYHDNYGQAAPIFGPGCNHGSWDWASYRGGTGQGENTFRCALSVPVEQKENEKTGAQSNGETMPTGAYNNRIALLTLDVPYSEICFKNGSTYMDIHEKGESTRGGQCLPGQDIGFIIEKNKRGGTSWYMAKKTCLENGMRLPETIEWKMACFHEKEWNLVNMANGGEWVGNSPTPFFRDNGSGIGSHILGKRGCHDIDNRIVAYSSGYSANHAFRCVR
ncbi:MAG: hypothetical protein OXB88_08945 [Bacteriovoracales bacterium]|nr:hypothetical protein [Bacteriovoracales bacterium]